MTVQLALAITVGSASAHVASATMPRSFGAQVSLSGRGDMAHRRERQSDRLGAHLFRIDSIGGQAELRCLHPVRETATLQKRHDEDVAFVRPRLAALLGRHQDQLLLQEALDRQSGPAFAACT